MSLKETQTVSYSTLGHMVMFIANENNQQLSLRAVVLEARPTQMLV